LSSSGRTTRRQGQASAARRSLGSRFQVTFWGVRGSIPSPGPRTRVFGGNTSCVELRCGEQLLIFDLGSGARALGESLRLRGAPTRADLFLSHYHYDHLQGLPFFSPMFDGRNSFVIRGPTRGQRDVQAILAGQMVPPYFPVTAEEVFLAKVEYRPVAEGELVQLGEVQVRALELHHPGASLGYRVDFEGHSVVYATDIEHGSPVDGRLADFARGTDVLIYDAMYTPEEYAGSPGKVGWGHSTWEAAVQAAQAADARTLVLFHHDPERDDAALRALERRAQRQRPGTLAAREGMTLSVGPSVRAAARSRAVATAPARQAQ
jgi:phosphoribosyl 1,2-cyclic phosphodiesterase